MTVGVECRTGRAGMVCCRRVAAEVCPVADVREPRLSEAEEAAGRPRADSAAEVAAVQAEACTAPQAGAPTRRLVAADAVRSVIQSRSPLRPNRRVRRSRGKSMMSPMGRPDLVIAISTGKSQRARPRRAIGSISDREVGPARPTRTGGIG